MKGAHKIQLLKVRYARVRRENLIRFDFEFARVSDFGPHVIFAVKMT